jgi:A/G-specific adenine glycosylase
MLKVSQKIKIQTLLIRWFDKNKRDLPWRKTRNPYAVWVSEIMLQQTQVDTVIPYYQRFLKAFPTVKILARSNLAKVLKVWEGLGYYSRARNLHQASRIIVKDFGNKIPGNLKDLLGLPGIGRYTAGAILSIAFDKKAAVLDGNVKRVLSRLFAVSGDPAKGKTEGLLWSLSESLVPEDRASSFNQALMDLGATVCTPKAPQCPRCPLQTFCKGRLWGDPEQYPSPKAKRVIPHIDGVSAVIMKDGKALLIRRALKGLLGGLWEFPSWETEEKQSSSLRIRLRNCIKKEMGMNVKIRKSLGVFRQTFSHFKLTLHVYYCEGGNETVKGKWIPIQKLRLLPMSRIHRKIADKIA